MIDGNGFWEYNNRVTTKQFSVHLNIMGATTND